MTPDLLLLRYNGDVVHASQQPEGWRTRTVARSASWPTWRPGATAQFLASQVLDSGEAALIVGGADDEAELEVARTAAGASIAPRVHHYALWAPTGERLFYVMRSGDQLTLSTYETATNRYHRDLAKGAPIFSAWSRDGRYVICHAGLSLQVLDAVRGGWLREVTNEGAGFRVAAVSDSGLLAYAVPESGAVRVLVANVTGGEATELARMAGGVAMAFRPGTEELAVGLTRSPQTGAFEELWLIDAATGSKVLLSRGPYVSFFWSPSGERVALVVPSQTGDGRHYHRIIDATGTQIAAAEAVVPSPESRIMYGFFDQYGLSHSPWLPDGSGLLLSGRRVDDSVHGSLGDPIGDGVFLWKASRGAPLEFVGPGTIAVAAGSPLSME